MLKTNSKDIKDKIFEKEEPKNNTSNDIYINSFKTPLFLHKKAEVLLQSDC